MKKPEYKNYRVCYDNGNSKTGVEIYELNKYCDCQDCKNRLTFKREPSNQITATTKDITKVDEIEEYLKNWTCNNGNKMLERLFYKF